MATPTTVPKRSLEQNSQEDKLIDYYPFQGDYSHLMVCRFRQDGTAETIGHVYTEVDGEETRYISTGRDGRELFPATTDFETVNLEFEHLARLLAVQDMSKENIRQLHTTNYSPSKNSKAMQTNQKNQEPKQKKINQLIFVEYEKATGDGHFVTIVDSYRNVIGKIHKTFNEALNKFEYAAYDFAGKLIAKGEKLWELKKEFTNNRTELLEQAHQRRIESKEKANQSQEQKVQPAKTEERKKEIETVRNGKKGQEKEIAKVEKPEHIKTNERPSGKDQRISQENNQTTSEQNLSEDREQELEDLREDLEDERGDIDLER